MSEPGHIHTQIEETASFLRRAFRHVKVALVPLVAGAAATVGIAQLVDPLYKSESTVQFKPGVPTGDLGSHADADNPRTVTARLTEMFTSRNRLEKLIREQDLYPDVVAKHNHVEAVEEMKRHLSIQAREGLTFRISYEAGSRESAQQILQKLIDSVVAEDLALRRERAVQAKAFFDGRKKEVEDELHLKEGALSKFLAAHPSLAAETASYGASAGGTLRAAERARTAATGVDTMGLELQAARLQEELARARAEAAAGLPPTPISTVPPAPELLSAEERVRSAKRDLEDKLASLTTEHPDVKTAQRRLAEAEANLRQAHALYKPVPSSAAAPVDTSASKIASLERMLNAVNSQLRSARRPATSDSDATLRNPEKAATTDTEWTRLVRDVAEAKERREVLEGKQFQAALWLDLVEKGDGGKVVILDPPFRPAKPIAGKRSQVFIVGGALSLVLAVLAMLGAALLDDRLYGARDVRRVVGHELMVVVVPRLPPMNE